MCPTVDNCSDALLVHTYAWWDVYLHLFITIIFISAVSHGTRPWKISPWKAGTAGQLALDRRHVVKIETAIRDSRGTSADRLKTEEVKPTKLATTRKTRDCVTTFLPVTRDVRSAPREDRPESTPRHRRPLLHQQAHAREDIVLQGLLVL